MRRRPYHARYGRQQIRIAIGSGQILKGALPPRALALVVEWAAIHRVELERDWELAQARQPLDPIEPLR